MIVCSTSAAGVSVGKGTTTTSGLDVGCWVTTGASVVGVGPKVGDGIGVGVGGDGTPPPDDGGRVGGGGGVGVNTASTHSMLYVYKKDTEYSGQMRPESWY